MPNRLVNGLAVVGGLLVGLAAPALAQLTSADIDALRERGVREGWTFTMRESEVTQRPRTELCGTVEPADWQLYATFDECAPQRDLPSAFTSWDAYAMTPIKNQLSCGSCWAFGAIGAMEAAIRLRTRWIVDLSEQWLVSCTTAGTCNGGWHTTSFDYLKCNGLQDAYGGTGAVLESAFPYRASDVACQGPYAHPYCLDSWAVVGPQWGMATVEQIKQAVYDHGPVATCVYVNSAFQAYWEGVFNACEDKRINHVVVIVGWDDSQGAQGAWKIRNSWGPQWGKSGYMWIEYGCCQIGYATCYVENNWVDCTGNGIHDAIDIRLARSQDTNSNRIPDECERVAGDLNCDGAVNFADINPFVLALRGRIAYVNRYPTCLWSNADVNGDGEVDYGDINAFVTAVVK